MRTYDDTRDEGEGQTRANQAEARQFASAHVRTLPLSAAFWDLLLHCVQLAHALSRTPFPIPT